MALSDREWERIKILVSLSNFTYDYTNIHLKDNSQRKYLTDSLEKYGGLKDMLRGLYENPDTRFIDMYKNTFSSTFGFHRRQILPDKYINTFNQLFLFLETYRFNSDDFDNFKVIVDDILSCTYSKDFLFDKVRWNMIDRVISNRNYKNVPELGRAFKFILTSDKDEFKDAYLYYRSMFLMLDNVLDSNDDKSFEVANSIIKYALDNYNREEHPVMVDLVYSDILLDGDRFSYVNNKLKEVEPNIYIRRDIFSRIISLNNNMFSDLSNEEDYFIKCLNIVFDSDSYTELTSKLNLISTASSLYDAGKSKEAYEMLYLLDDIYHKEVIDGTVVSYNGPKPNTIVERMADLYSKIDSSKTKEFILDIHSSVSSISSLYVGIGVIQGKVEDEFQEEKFEKVEKTCFVKVKSFIDRLIPKKDI